MPINHPSIVYGNDFNYPTSESGNILTVFEHIDISVNRFPHKVAIQYHNESLTYAELFNYVNGLSSVLRDAGVLPGAYVAVYAHRNIDYWICVLAILKMGAIYIPLDPYSLENTLRDTLEILPNVTLIKGKDLSAEHEEKLSRVSYDIPSIRLMSFERVASSHLIESAIIGPDDIRYAIPTSGSTGKPKCVLVPERSMLLQEFAKIHDTHLTSDDVVAQSTTQTFDVHIWQGIAPLMVGATVVVLDRCQADSTMILLNEIVEKRISLFQLVPSMLGILLNDFEKMTITEEFFTKIQSLRLLAVTGEALPAKHCLRWIVFFQQHQKLPPLIVNMYGPAECGDDVGHYVISTEDQCLVETIPVCVKPIFNTVFYLLNPQGELVDDGEEGILYIAGDCVGAGYLNAPEKTMEAFKKHTILGEEVYLYNTGDRVCVRSGVVVFLARVANSYVKLAGKRVELDGFSNLLLKHRGVAQAVTVKFPDVDKVATYVTLTPQYIAAKKEDVQQGRSQDVASIFDHAVDDSKYTDNFNHGGWNNYIPGVAFTERAVQENLNDALSYIKTFTHEEAVVLEVGCGSGMLSRETARNCGKYVGVDISEKSIEIARKSCVGLSNVFFHVCDADALEQTLRGQRFDVIFFNAVINYFGSPEKLEEVLRQASRLLTERGKILVLDVYHLNCKSLLHTQFEFLKLMDKSISVAKLKEKIEKAKRQDPDLFVHPAFFERMTYVLPGICVASCHLKMGEATDAGFPNPMVRYRYGVILDKENSFSPLDETAEIIDFNERFSSIQDVLQYLETTAAEIIKICNIPNHRILEEYCLRNLISAMDSQISVESIRRKNSLFSRPLSAIDPARLQEEIAKTNYKIINMMFDADKISTYEVIIVRKTCTKQYKLDLMPKQKCELSNFPILDQAFHLATSELKAYLSRLSEHATYHVVIPLSVMPLNPNGKIDREALIASYQSSVILSLDHFQDVITEYEIGLKNLLMPILEKQGGAQEELSKYSLFVSIGMTSLDMVRLSNEIKRVYDLDISVEILLSGSESLFSLACRVDDKISQRSLSSEAQSHCSMNVLCER